MLYYDRIDVFEWINVNKISELKEYDIFHYWYILHKDFKFRLNVCNGCHDLLMMPMNISDIVILNIKGSDYCCNIREIRKNEAINFMQNADLTEISKTQ